MTLTKPFENVRWALEENLGLIASSKFFLSYGMNLVYNLTPYTPLTPYIFGGFSGDIGENSSYLGYDAGLGLRFVVAADWMASVQTKGVWYGGGHDPEWLVEGLLSIPFGESKKILDVDGDGIPNYRDDSPDTPAGAMVDVRGNFLEMNLNINFETNSDVVSTSYYEVLKSFSVYLNNHPEQKIEIQGHSDDVIASGNFNLDLSFRRATSVAKILTVTYDIPADQLSVNGYGAKRPLVKNDSDEHRAMNRRIDAVLKK